MLFSISSSKQRDIVGEIPLHLMWTQLSQISQHKARWWLATHLEHILHENSQTGLEGLDCIAILPLQTRKTQNKTENKKQKDR